MSSEDRKRPSSISRTEHQLRWALYDGTITKEEYEIEYQKLKQNGKVTK